MTKEMQFKVGDVVTLKSGGPEMTIDKFVWNPMTGEYHSDRVECVWFVKEELKREIIQTSSLIIEE